MVSSVCDGSRKPAYVFVESSQQAAARAISASFTGGTAQAFHLGQGYRSVPPEQKTTMHHRLDQTQQKAGVCMFVWRGRALSSQQSIGWWWVVLTKMHIRRRGKDYVSTLYLVISDIKSNAWVYKNIQVPTMPVKRMIQ